MKYTVIGISDSCCHEFSREILNVISSGKVFSGGRRHHELVAHLLPPNANWINIGIPLDNVFEKYQKSDSVIVFASGDPLFYGFANTIRSRYPDAEIKIYPYFNSLQTLAHKLVMPYHDMRVVSLTGRPWHEFDRALIEGSTMIGVLTDREHTPATIAQRMLDYGYCDYTMHVGEHLGNDSKERISTFSLSEACDFDAAYPNCIILIGNKKERRWGLPDAEFSLLDGRKKMITKMPIRLISLQALDLLNHDMLIDIGFCTGSISIEAKLQFPHLVVYAIEVRPECEELMAINSHRFGALGITTEIADFNDIDISRLNYIFSTVTGRKNPRKAFFIGGHNGRLPEIITKIDSSMKSGDVIVMNSVAEQSRIMFEETSNKLGLNIWVPMRITIDNYNTITIMKCTKR